jgi:maltose O-acetyltransferase
MDLKQKFNNIIIEVLAVLIEVPYMIFANNFRRLANLYRHALWKVKLNELGFGTVIKPYVIINNPGLVRIGKNVSIQEFVHIWGGGEVEIGDNTTIATHSIITSLTHAMDVPLFKESLIKQKVKIGQNVWVGSGAVIFPGISIGDGAIIGAGAVVTRDVDSGATVVGVPARPVSKKVAEFEVMGN